MSDKVKLILLPRLTQIQRADVWRQVERHVLGLSLVKDKEVSDRGGATGGGEEVVRPDWNGTHPRNDHAKPEVRVALRERWSRKG